MEKLTISRITEPKRVEYVDKKTGKSAHFEKVGVQTGEWGDRWFNFNFHGDLPFKVGDCMDFEIVSREYQGKAYLDLRIPKKEVSIAKNATLEKIEKDVAKILAILESKKTVEPEVNKTDDIRPEDIPF